MFLLLADLPSHGACESPYCTDGTSRDARTKTCQITLDLGMYQHSLRNIQFVESLDHIVGLRPKASMCSAGTLV